jgi:hypothetical protein
VAKEERREKVKQSEIRNPKSKIIISVDSTSIKKIKTHEKNIGFNLFSSKTMQNLCDINIYPILHFMLYWNIDGAQWQ